MSEKFPDPPELDLPDPEPPDMNEADAINHELEALGVINPNDSLPVRIENLIAHLEHRDPRIPTTPFCSKLPHWLQEFMGKIKKP
ncbi:MAG: hypothetical protein WCJ84_03975 [Candidatus Peregrinibacteria bacterium]